MQLSAKEKMVSLEIFEGKLGIIIENYGCRGDADNIIGGIFFGYLVWLDILINPAWWPGLFYINLLFKAAITFIQFFGIYYFVKDLFAIGTGTRG